MAFLAKLSWAWKEAPTSAPEPLQALPMPRDERFALPMSPSSLRLPSFRPGPGLAQEPAHPGEA